MKCFIEVNEAIHQQAQCRLFVLVDDIIYYTIGEQLPESIQRILCPGGCNEHARDRAS